VCVFECMHARVGQNRIYTPYMTVYLMISLPKILYIYTVYDRIYGDFPAKNTLYVWFWPTLMYACICVYQEGMCVFVCVCVRARVLSTSTRTSDVTFMHAEFQAVLQLRRVLIVTQAVHMHA
jgi:hypothetical protein